MIKKINSTSDIYTALSALRSQKYNAGLLLESIAERLTRSVYVFRDAPGIIQLDILDNLLSEIAIDNERPLGVYDINDLAMWLEGQSADIGAEQGIVCTEIDALLATLPRAGVQDFFSVVDRLVLQKPIVLVTKLREIVAASQFSTDRIWELDIREVI